MSDRISAAQLAAAHRKDVMRLAEEIERLRGEAEAATRAASEAIAHVREHYSESIFPPRPPGQHSEVYDGEAASVARLTCDNILREFEERLADARGSSVRTQESEEADE